MKKLPNDATVLAWILIHRCNRKLLEQVGSALKQNQLPPLDWYDVLLELQRAKSEGLRQFEIGERILLSKHNLSRLIDRLENQALLRRLPSEEDGRGYRIVITPEGERMLKKVWPVYGEAIQRELGEKLNQSEISELVHLMTKVLA